MCLTVIYLRHLEGSVEWPSSCIEDVSGGDLFQIEGKFCQMTQSLHWGCIWQWLLQDCGKVLWDGPVSALRMYVIVASLRLWEGSVRWTSPSIEDVSGSDLFQIEGRFCEMTQSLHWGCIWQCILQDCGKVLIDEGCCAEAGVIQQDNHSATRCQATLRPPRPPHTP